MEFRERLEKLCEERKLSQSGLARQIYVSRSAVAKRENGSGFPGKSRKNARRGLNGPRRCRFPPGDRLSSFAGGFVWQLMPAAGL